MKICMENNFYISVPSDLELWPLDVIDFKFAPLVSIVERYVSTKSKLEIYFEKSEARSGRTDRRTG